MPLFDIIILAIIQGLTEFLPVSSSGHLVLTHEFLGNNISDLCWEQNRMIDVAVHVGTLFSVLLYFRSDIITIVRGIIAQSPEGLKLLQFLIIASIPVVLAGLGLHLLKPDWLCLIQIMAWTTLIFGIVLWVADHFSKADKDLSGMTYKDAVIVGCAQMLALIPGTSRSGITMTAARFLGFTRVEAAHFSLLLSIVAIGGAGFLSTLDLIETQNFDLGLDVLLAAFLAFISGWAAIAVMMRWLQHSTFTPFAIYRIVLGLVLLGLIYTGIL